MICRKDGIERKFLIFKGEKRPQKTKIYEKETTEPNGVKVTVQLRNSYQDKSRFLEAIRSQLPYFPTVVFDIEGSPELNDSKIFENDLFQWSSMYPKREMHISFGGVNYPIDWNSLKMSRLSIPIAIKIGLDAGLSFTFNREEFNYTDKTIELFTSKIKEISTWFVDKYNEKHKEYDTLIEAYDFINPGYFDVKLGDSEFNINELVKYSSKAISECTVKGMELFTPKFYKNSIEDLLGIYNIVGYYSHSGYIREKIWRHTSLKSHVLHKNKVVMVSETLKGNHKEYLKEKYGSGTMFVVKGKDFPLKDISVSTTYCNILYLRNYPKNQWRARIQEFQNIRETIEANFINEVGSENSKEFLEWIEERKNERREHRAKYPYQYKGLNKKEGDISIGYGQYSNSRVVFKKEAISLERLKVNRFLTVYFLEEDREKAKLLHPLSLTKRVKIAIIGKRDAEKISQFQNFVKFEDFMSTKPFVRFVTAVKANKTIKNYDALRIPNDLLQNVIEKYADDVRTLRLYVNEHHCNLDKELEDSMMEIAEKDKLFDLSMMEVINRVDKNITKFDFLPALKVPNHWHHDEVARYKKLINQMLLFRKLYYNDFQDFTICVNAPVEELEAI